MAPRRSQAFVHLILVSGGTVVELRRRGRPTAVLLVVDCLDGGARSANGAGVTQLNRITRGRRHGNRALFGSLEEQREAPPQIVS